MKPNSLLTILLMVGVSNLSLALPREFSLSTKDTCQLAGIYATVEDFASNRLSTKVDLKASSNKFLQPSLANATVLTLILNGKTTSYKPGSIYGYLHCGQKFRYQDGIATGKEDYYLFVEEAGMIIYSLPQKEEKNTKYFYSTSLKTPVKLLTIANLQTDYKSNPAFLKELSFFKDRNGQYHLSSKDQEGHFNVRVLLELFTKQ